VVEAFSRVVKLRYLPSANTKEVCEELMEVILSFGNRPQVMRTDGGPPFDANEFKEWCREQGIEPIKGLSGHSRGQGMVETRFKGIAEALRASLGGKAPTAWFKGDTLARLEGIINSTYVESIGGSPWWVLNGLEPHTPLSARTD
jgi:transposase InsO family protein